MPCCGQSSEPPPDPPGPDVWADVTPAEPQTIPGQAPPDAAPPAPNEE